MDTHWLVVSFLRDEGTKLAEFVVNKRHCIKAHSTTLAIQDDIFLDESHLHFFLLPQFPPSYVFGTGYGVDFRTGTHCPLGTTARQFHLLFNQNHAWVLVDDSDTGTKVNGKLVVSSESRAPIRSRRDVSTPPRSHVVLHPDVPNEITCGEQRLWISILASQPDTIVDHTCAPGVDPPRDLRGLSAGDIRALVQRSPRNTHYVLQRPAFESTRAHVLMYLHDGPRTLGKLYREDEELDARERFRQLFPILRSDSEGRVAAFIDSIVLNNHYCIVSEYYGEHATLSRCLTQVDLRTLECVFTFILDALCFLHAHGVMHRDVSPRTILVRRHSPIHPRLTGFLESILATQATGARGDVRFGAPEMRSGTRRYNARVDVFSLGQMINHVAAIADVPYADTLLQDFVGRCLTQDAAVRPAARDLKALIVRAMDGGHKQPFRSVAIRRRFEISWLRDRDNLLVRVEDLWAIVQRLGGIHAAEEMTAFGRTKTVNGNNGFDGVYCKAKYGRWYLELGGLSSACTALFTAMPPVSGHFTTLATITGKLYYHPTSQMWNVTTLLRMVTGNPRVAWQLEPVCVQEVVGHPECSGINTDRETFSSLADRIAEACSGDVDIDMPPDPTDPKSCRFRQVDYLNQVIVVTGLSLPPWVLLSRTAKTAVADGPCEFGSLDALTAWCSSVKLCALADRLDSSLSQPISVDWRKVPTTTRLPLEADDNATSVLSTAFEV